MRHIIQDHERGHRKPLSEDEKTLIYAIRVTETVKHRLSKLNPCVIRSLINFFLKILDWHQAARNTEADRIGANRPEQCKQDLVSILPHCPECTAKWDKEAGKCSNIDCYMYF